MIRTRIAGIFVFSVVAVAILAGQSAQPAKPGPDHQKLAAFVGKWNTEGESFVSPYGPAGKITAVDTYAWLPGNFFLDHKFDGKQGTLAFSGTEILGYDAAAKAYVTHVFDNFGNTGTSKGTAKGNIYSFTADTVVAGKPLKERGTVTVAKDTITSKWEYSSDGMKWLPNFEVKLTRAK